MRLSVCPSAIGPITTSSIKVQLSIKIWLDVSSEWLKYLAWKQQSEECLLSHKWKLVMFKHPKPLITLSSRFADISVVQVSPPVFNLLAIICSANTTAMKFLFPSHHSLEPSQRVIKILFSFLAALLVGYLFTWWVSKNKYLHQQERERQEESERKIHDVTNGFVEREIWEWRVLTPVLTGRTQNMRS